MSVKLNLEGLNELRAALQAAPEEITDKAAFIVTKYASIAKHQIEDGYPVRQTNLHPGQNRKTPWYAPGNLKSRVTITNNAARRVGTVSIVKSNAPHAWLYDNGSRNRLTSKGADRGQMPARPIAERMIAKVIRLRAAMVGELIELVRSAGFEVSE